MSDFHISAEIPPDATPAEATQIRAKAIQTALMHAATDAPMRVKMILGEAFGRYVELIAWMDRELANEPVTVRELVMRFAEGGPAPSDDSAIVKIQRSLAEDWRECAMSEWWPTKP